MNCDTCGGCGHHMRNDSLTTEEVGSVKEWRSSLCKTCIKEGRISETGERIISSKTYSVTDVARWYCVPPHMLAATENKGAD